MTIKPFILQQHEEHRKEMKKLQPTELSAQEMAQVGGGQYSRTKADLEIGGESIDDGIWC